MTTNITRFTQAVDALKAVETHDGEVAGLVIGIIEQIEAIPAILDRQMKVGEWIEEREATKPDHPTFLHVEDDYVSAPVGTVVRRYFSEQRYEKVNLHTWATDGCVMLNNSAMADWMRPVERWGEDG